MSEPLSHSASAAGGFSAASGGRLFSVELQGVSRSFGKQKALDGLSCRFAPGHITGIVGPDGAGKTTLLRLIAGLLSPDAGTLRVFGRSPQETLVSDPNSIGYMPQRFGLYEDLSVQANLQLHADLRGLESAARDDLFRRLLDFTGLAPFTSRLAGRLSGGMKQKLGIACALLGSPRLLVLDEPGVGVDPLSRRELWRMVNELADGGMTVLWSTAYLDEAERCPDMLLLDGGRALYAGPPADFLGRVAGRVFLLPRESGGSRGSFQRWAAREGVEDVSVQGARLRILAGKDAPGALTEELSARGVPARPRLEDAYMSALGGLNRAPSPYAARAARPAAEGPAIEADGLTKRFGRFTAVENLSFRVEHGRIFGLLGPNGAGKSTAFRMLCGLSRPSAGRCFVAGVDLLHAPGKARASLGYMAQKFSLYPDIPVRENIRVFADLYGLDKALRLERSRVLAEALGLEDFLGQITSTLSLGLKQRLALLCATLHNPAVLFLDEPTSGVDARTRRDFWKHILAMTDRGASVLVTTHCMDEAEYCDRVALIYRGTMIREGTPDELKARCREEDGAQGDPTLEDAFTAAIVRWNEEHGEA